LYDMHGNVLEWCQDIYSVPTGGIALDPRGPATGAARVFRGGDWSHYNAGCRSAFRVGLSPSSTYYNLGLRVVLASGQP
jgi:formylglycine-generating enzyme required for sulfatase activity